MARCQAPPAGWTCTRPAPHDGPCAAVLRDPDAEITQPIDARFDAPSLDLKPFSMLRVVFDGDPATSRIEAVQSDGRGGEIVIDVPCESFSMVVDYASSRLVLVLGPRSFEVRAGVPVDDRQLADLLELARSRR